MKKYFNFSWGWGRKKDPPKNGTSSNNCLLYTSDSAYE